MPTTTLTSATAKIDRLDFSASEIDTLKAKLLELTGATVIVRSTQRDANGKIQYIEVADTGIQLAATVKALEFAVGKPKQMIAVQTGPDAAGKPQDLRQILQKNPDLVRSILGHMQETLKNAQAVEVEEVKADKADQLGEIESSSPHR